MCYVICVKCKGVNCLLSTHAQTICNLLGVQGPNSHAIIYIFNLLVWRPSFEVRTWHLLTSDSDVHRRQILNAKVNPRADFFKMHNLFQGQLKMPKRVVDVIGTLNLSVRGPFLYVRIWRLAYKAPPPAERAKAAFDEYTHTLLSSFSSVQTRDIGTMLA